MRTVRARPIGKHLAFELGRISWFGFGHGSDFLWGWSAPPVHKTGAIKITSSGRSRAPPLFQRSMGPKLGTLSPQARPPDLRRDSGRRIWASAHFGALWAAARPEKRQSLRLWRIKSEKHS